MAPNDHRTYVYAGLTHTAIMDPSTDPIHKFWRRAEGENEWQDITFGLPDHPKVRSILVHTKEPNIVYVGHREGVFRSDDRGDHWEALDTPKHLATALAFHPENTNTMFLGYDLGTDHSVGIYRSDNAGETWRELNTKEVSFPHITSWMVPTDKRVTQFAIDPINPMNMYASIEVGGLLASEDGGENWEQMIDGPFLSNRNLDLHGVAVTAAAPDNVFICTCVGLFRSRDKGNHWEHVPVKNLFTLITENKEFPAGGAYCRAISVAPNDPKTIYVTASCGGGNVLPGTKRAAYICRSRDVGETWELLDLEGDPATGNMSQIAIDQANPSHVYCNTRLGHVYASKNGGDTFSLSQLPLDLMPEPNLYSPSLGAG
jgi:photosystem II stability/assembly factor-like uncharacterized protein